MHLFLRLLAFLKPYTRGAVLSLVLAALAMVATVAIPWLTGRAVDHIRAHDESGLAGAREGDLAFASPGLPHAFAAAPGADADLLIVITPGVERFEYFRHLERIAYGKVPPESLLEVQELYDTYFLNSTNWNDARP